MQPRAEIARADLIRSFLDNRRAARANRAASLKLLGIRPARIVRQVSIRKIRGCATALSVLRGDAHCRSKVERWSAQLARKASMGMRARSVQKAASRTVQTRRRAQSAQKVGTKTLLASPTVSLALLGGTAV